METNKSVVLVLGVLFLSVECFSQNRDTIANVTKDSVNIPRRAIAYAAYKFAIVRPLNIEFTHSAPYNFTSRIGSNSLPESNVNSLAQAKVSANFNFIKSKTWLLGATVGYRFINGEANMTDQFSGDIKKVNDEFHYLFSSVNFSYFSTLFKKRTIYSSSLMVDGK